jgi:hypothetical protein
LIRLTHPANIAGELHPAGKCVAFAPEIEAALVEHGNAEYFIEKKGKKVKKVVEKTPPDPIAEQCIGIKAQGGQCTCRARKGMKTCLAHRDQEPAETTQQPEGGEAKKEAETTENGSAEGPASQKQFGRSSKPAN